MSKKACPHLRGITPINLRDYYPDFYKMDYIIDVPIEVLEVMQESKRKEATYQRKRYRYKAHYSLDRGDGIENDTLFSALIPQDIFEQQEQQALLHWAIDELPETQARRIRAHYLLGIGILDIAKMEGVTRSVVDESIRRGLHNLFIFLEKME